MYSLDIEAVALFLVPSGLKVSSVFPRILKSAYSFVANKLVAFTPTARITATAKTPIILVNSFNSLSLNNL